MSRRRVRLVLAAVALILVGSVLATLTEIPTIPVKAVPNNTAVTIHGVQYVAQNANRPWSLLTERNYERFEVLAGDNWSHDSLSEDELTKNRDELRGPRASFDTTDKVGWALRIPESTDLSPAHTVVAQFHATADPLDCAHRSPVLQFLLVGTTGRLKIVTKSDPNRVSLEVPPVVVRYQGRPLARGVWNRFAVSVAFTRTGDGHLIVRLNGRKIVDEPAIPIGYNDELAPYFKFGIYRPAGPQTTVLEWTDVRDRALTSDVVT